MTRGLPLPSRLPRMEEEIGAAAVEAGERTVHVPEWEESRMTDGTASSSKSLPDEETGAARRGQQKREGNERAQRVTHWREGSARRMRPRCRV